MILAIAVGLALAIGPVTLLMGISPVSRASGAPAPMVLTYNTTLGGNTLDLPLTGGSVTVDWGDGTTNASLTHTYTSPGLHTVSISGAATHFGYLPGYCTADVGSSGITAVASFGDLGITSLRGAFDGATHLTSVPTALPPGVTDTTFMFCNASAFNGSIGAWDTSAVTDMTGMFIGATSFNQPIGAWNTGAVTRMDGMFNGATAFNQPIGAWNTSAVTVMGGMFGGAVRFNQPIASWNTTAVTNMSTMFDGATAFNQPIGTWNTAAVTEMSLMFNGAAAFNQPIARWNTTAVTDMFSMFWGARHFNQPIGNWNTASVTNMAAMFRDAAAFNQPIGRWNTAAVTGMDTMFWGARSFNQPIGSWNTARVEYFDGMFKGAARFNQPIGTWNTAWAVGMNSFFYGAARFNQPIGTWNTSRVRDMNHMFGNGSRLSTSNYDQLLIGWAARPQIHHVHLDAGSSTYNGAARAAHNTLRVKDGWTIVDGGRTYRKATPQITRAPRIAPITYGKVLKNASVIDGAANTRGRFFLTRSPLALSAGTHRLTVIFRPAQTAYYTTTTTTILVRVNPRHLTLGLTGLTTAPHGQSVTVTVVRLIAGARVTVALQLSGSPGVYTHLTAKGPRVKVALSLPTAGTYTVTASATKTNYVFTGATGLVTAT